MSDKKRDLLTQETSPVSGTTTFTYNEHGELLTSTDARRTPGITVTREVDALDRVTKVDQCAPKPAVWTKAPKERVKCSGKC